MLTVASVQFLMNSKHKYSSMIRLVIIILENYRSGVHQTGHNSPECRHNACTTEYIVRFDNETLQHCNLYNSIVC